MAKFSSNVVSSTMRTCLDDALPTKVRISAPDASSADIEASSLHSTLACRVLPNAAIVACRSSSSLWTRRKYSSSLGFAPA